MKIPSPHSRPLLITFHCGIFFLYLSVFLMSISNRELESHFSQMGPQFIPVMLGFMGVFFIAYLGLWNQRRWSLILLLAAGPLFIFYGFRIGNPILLNFIPMIAGVTCLPLWPVMK